MQQTNKPDITPLNANTNQPLWSVMIPTYNCADYLRLTLTGVLAQDPGPDQMQIEVVDDGSTKDDPEAVVRELGSGRVQFYRQPHNVGAIANFNTCVQRSRGKLVHLLHGDDLVHAGFYRQLEAPFLENEAVGAAFCRFNYMDEHGNHRLTTRPLKPSSGILTHALPLLAVSNRIGTPSIVVRRQVYETIGGYNHQLFHSADWEMWVRIASQYAIWYETEALASYRVHSQSDTSRLFNTGANMQDRRNCIAACRQYLPPRQANHLTRKALGYSGLYGLRLASRLARTGRWQTSWVQLREATICLLKSFQPRPA
ncbi:MAG: glycosyltransferase [Anaerolineae bacterium]|nr:glycosyltransferase [Anaerolineae bacterium]